jgi:hypothetical protein
MLCVRSSVGATLLAAVSATRQDVEDAEYNNVETGQTTGAAN